MASKPLTAVPPQFSRWPHPPPAQHTHTLVHTEDKPPLEWDHGMHVDISLDHKAILPVPLSL